jgi:CRISPR/Cas system endoribonuclease Cas6 (RAMP superfamily)
VITNLLYYQSNYFAVALAFVLISCLVHSQEIIVGSTAVAGIIGAILFALSKNAQLVQVSAFLMEY